MAAFVVKAKKGAIVRAACALASEKVDALACGTAVTVAETVETNGGLRCRLEEGDAMYVPSLWHHAVHSEAGGDGRNVAVNFFLTSTVSREAADAMHSPL